MIHFHVLTVKVEPFPFGFNAICRVSKGMFRFGVLSRGFFLRWMPTLLIAFRGLLRPELAHMWLN